MQTNAHDVYIIILQSSRTDWVLSYKLLPILNTINFFFHRMFASTKNSFLIILGVPARLSANATHCRIVFYCYKTCFVFSTHSVVVLLCDRFILQLLA